MLSDSENMLVIRMTETEAELLHRALDILRDRPAQPAKAARTDGVLSDAMEDALDELNGLLY